MTWGKQNTEQDAHRQLGYAFDLGVNFLDTAEMYPVPPAEDTQGHTDRYIGSWLPARRRDDVILATKVLPRQDCSAAELVCSCGFLQHLTSSVLLSAALQLPHPAHVLPLQIANHICCLSGYPTLCRSLVMATSTFPRSVPQKQTAMVQMT